MNLLRSRRWAMASIRGSLLLMVLTLTTAALAAAHSGADWPQFLGPNRNGTYSGPAITNAWPKEGPPKIWERKVGQGFSGPVVAAGKVILFHRPDKETVECLQARDGKSLWKADYPTGFRDEIRAEDDGPRSTPAIDGTHVYTFGAEGMLNCWNLANGERIWSGGRRCRPAQRRRPKRCRNCRF